MVLLLADPGIHTVDNLQKLDLVVLPKKFSPHLREVGVEITRSLGHRSSGYILGKTRSSS
jgi:hypothetical protein